jgi:hypothetical protein
VPLGFEPTLINHPTFIRKYLMKKNSIIFLLASSFIMIGCQEKAPSIEELVSNDELFKKIGEECKTIGDKEKQFEVEKCLNMHKAADKRMFR